jgi:XTP/dITP diphosphohydrolase
VSIGKNVALLCFIRRDEVCSYYDKKQGAYCTIGRIHFAIGTNVAQEGKYFMKKKLIFATNNQGKINEIKQILDGERFQVFALKDLNMDIDIEETGTTFEENAVIKAKAIMEMTGEMVLADDSGFEVDYMDKEPGVYSARFLGENTSYDIKNAEILKRCQDAREGERAARFVCVIACAFPDGNVVTTTGIIEGELAKRAVGKHGFGYDPIFYLPERGMTTAQMLPEEKNKISHRGIALRKMVDRLDEILSSQ